MKLVLISQVFPPQTGGSGRWFWEVYSRLPQEEICIVAGEYTGAKAFDRTHDVDVVRLPLHMPHWGLLNLWSMKTYWRLSRRLRQLIGQEDVQAVHAGRVVPEGWLAWMLSKRCGLPYSVYVHGEELNYGLQSRELGWMMRRVFGGAERVVVNSRNTARLMQNGWNVSAEKVTVLHPGVDTRRFQPAKVRQDGGPENSGTEACTILTVGRLQKRKGHDMLIRALPRIRAEIPDVRYAIVGEGDQRPILEALTREMGVSDCVQFLGEVGDEEMIRRYQECDLFALPNREVNGDIEGFGIVLLEAQACGKPVLAGDSGGTAETMIPGETGLIADCTGPELLASALIELLHDSERLAQMGQAAREWVVEQFDWESLAAKAKRIFDSQDVEDTSSSAKYLMAGFGA